MASASRSFPSPEHRTRLSPPSRAVRHENGKFAGGFIYTEEDCLSTSFKLVMKICVCAPTANVYSETFIREHIRRLPADVVLYGLPPYTMRNGRPLVPVPIRSLIARAERRYMRRIGSQAIRIADRQIASVLKQLGIGIVLAEYGPTAVSFLPVCRSAGVRLAVHFHGYDLSLSSTLKTYRAGYKALFAEAAAIIVVSAAMKRRLEKMIGPSERIFLIHYGVECEFFRAVNAAANPR